MNPRGCIHGSHRLRWLAVVLLCVGGWGSQVVAADDWEQARAAADRAFTNGMYAEAEQLYRRLLARGLAASEPRFVTTILGVVRSLFGQSHFNEAAEVLDSVPQAYAKLRQEHPKLPAALTREHQYLLTYWKGRLFLAGGQAEKALRQFKLAAGTEDPAQRRAIRRYTARCHLLQKDWAGANAIYQDMTRAQQPQATRRVGQLGHMEVLLRQEKWDALEEAFTPLWAKATKATETPADRRWYADLAVFRTVLLAEQGKPLEALKFYRSVFKGFQANAFQGQDHFLAVRTLGRRLTEGGQFDQARKLSSDTLPHLAFDRQRQELMLAMGEQAYAAGKAYEARNNRRDANKWLTFADRDFSRYLANYEQTTSAARVHFRRGELRLRRGRLLTQGAGDPPSKQVMAAARKLFDSGQEDLKAAAADQHATDALRYDAMLALAHYYRRQVTQYKRAAEWLARAGGLDVAAEQQARALLMRGDVLHKQLEEHAAAARQYEEVVRRFPQASIVTLARFKHADALFRNTEYESAAKIFGQFLDQVPAGHALRPTAMLYQGISYRHTARYEAAMKTLLTLADDPAARKTGQPLAPEALLQAAVAATAGGRPEDARRIATRLIDNFPDSEQWPWSVHQRIHLQLHAFNDVAAAEKDMNLFFTRAAGAHVTAHPGLAAEILLWLGDHYAADGDHARAEEYMKRIISEFPNSQHAPTSCYEAAKAAYYQRHYTDALAHLKVLGGRFAARADKATQARAAYLHGDILALQSEYAKAREQYAKAAELTQDGHLHYAAAGRAGDMAAAQAGRADKPRDYELYTNALERYNYVVDKGPQALKHKAMYRRARVKQRLNDGSYVVDLAAIFNSYGDGLVQQQHWDWYYFVRAGFDLAKHYEDRGQPADAVRVYSRIAEAATPFADEARARAKALREK